MALKFNRRSSTDRLAMERYDGMKHSMVDHYCGLMGVSIDNDPSNDSPVRAITGTAYRYLDLYSARDGLAMFLYDLTTIDADKSSKIDPAQNHLRSMIAATRNPKTLTIESCEQDVELMFKRQYNHRLQTCLQR